MINKVSETEFEKLAIANRDLRLERTKTGETILMPPTEGETGDRNMEICGQLWLWNRQNNLGKTFDSSTGFKLPNGAIRSPDAAWISLERWNALTSEQKQKFLPLCPDFAIELRSPADSLKTIQEKMLEYIDNGLLLGWLIDPINKKVEIYCPGKEVEILNKPNTVSGEAVLTGFSLDFSKIW